MQHLLLSLFSVIECSILLGIVFFSLGFQSKECASRSRRFHRRDVDLLPVSSPRRRRAEPF